MKTLGETVRKVEKSAVHGLQRLPGVSTVLGALDIGRPPNNQQTLMDSIGRVVLVGDFSYENDPEKRKNIAGRVVKMLGNKGIVDPVSSVDIRVMVPETSEEATAPGTTEEETFINPAADSLAHAFDDVTGGDLYMHIEPVVTPSAEDDNLAAGVGLRIGEVAPGCAGEAFGETLVVLANPVYLAKVFPHLRDHAMHGGGIAVLAEVGESPGAIRFNQLWPAAPPPLEDKVA